MGFLRPAVSQQVYGDDLATLVVEEVDPARFPPVPFEGRGESVHQQHRRIGHPGRVARRGNRWHRAERSPVAWARGPPHRDRADERATRRLVDVAGGGAREPRGVLDGDLLPEKAKAGDVLKAEADFEIEGITIVSVLAPKEPTRSGPERIEIIGSGQPDAPGVTTQLVGRSDRRPGDRRPRPG